MTGSRVRRDESRVIGGWVVRKETRLYQHIVGIVGLSPYPRTGLREEDERSSGTYIESGRNPFTRLPAYPQVDGTFLPRYPLGYIRLRSRLRGPRVVSRW